MPEPLTDAIVTCTDADLLEAAMNALATAPSEDEAQHELLEILTPRT